jgi:hypothetical protein
MKKLNVTIVYQMVGMSSISIPNDMTIEDAIQYAKEHIDEIPTPSPNNSNWIRYSDNIDEENCDFEEDYNY